MTPPGHCETHELLVDMVQENSRHIEAVRKEAKEDTAKVRSVVDDVRKYVYMGLGATVVLQIAIPVVFRYLIK